MEVYPDYYAALLFTRLMGPTVLAPTVQQTPTPDPSAPLRAYAHCTRAAATAETATAGMAGDKTVVSNETADGGGDVTLLMINLATDANVRKSFLSQLIMLKLIILPRQARYKHRKVEKGK
jgi:hypothetical protein